jgi:hypothetical protein
MKNTQSVSYIIKTNGSVVLFLSSGCETIANDHPNYNKVLAAIKARDFSNIENLVNVSKAIKSYVGTKVSIQNGEVFYGNFVLHNTLTNRILKMMEEGFKFDHMLAFIENLMQNPSNRAVNETYTFLENYGLPITDDGCFLAYKGVRNDYKDIYSGTIDNSVGSTPSMPRNMVDENYERDCSTGLHVGALDYVVHYGTFTKGEPRREGGNRLLIVKVNPKDVVSVPNYANHPKMRVSTYTVVSEILDVVKELDKVVYTAKATTLAPDAAKPMTSSGSEPVIDTTSAWNEVAYREGWADAELDLFEGRDYGYSRDYSAKNSYRIGYNDCFNGRANQAESTEQSSCDCGSSNCERDWEADEADAAPADTDYNRGYTCGYDDAEAMNGFQHSLDIDESDEFKAGYSDGYNEFHSL